MIPLKKELQFSVGNCCKFPSRHSGEGGIQEEWVRGRGLRLWPE